MIKIFRQLNSPFVIVTLLTSGIIIDLILIGRNFDLSKSDWGTWVGSLGTVLTLLGTIWLATNAERKRERESKILARLHSASMLLRLIKAKAQLGNAFQVLDHSYQTQNELTIEQIGDMHYRLDSIQNWHVSDLVPLAPLPNNTAVKLAQVADYINTSVDLLIRVSRHYPTLSHQERLNFVFTMHPMLKSTSEFLDQSIEVCNSNNT